MNKAKTYDVTLRVTTAEGNPEKWNWSELLDCGAGVISCELASIACDDCGHRCDPSGVCEKCGGDAMQPGDTLCVTCDARRSPNQKWRVYRYDLWADGEGGQTVNDVHRTDVVLDLTEDESESEVMTKLCAEMGGDPEKLGYDHNSEGGDDTIYVLDENGNPVCELRREEGEG